MWIRSQDKTKLVNVQGIFIPIYNDYQILGEINTDTSCDGYELGEYKTRERTIEVLNEIQEALISNENDKLNAAYYDGIIPLKSYPKFEVFQMPES